VPIAKVKPQNELQGELGKSL